MRLLHDLGVPQAMLPPQPRPNLDLLASLGFVGDATSIIERASREAPHLLAVACSSSFMWAANAATVSPSSDTLDYRLHLTPANLASSIHRAQETYWTTLVLRSVFDDPGRFAVHEPLPGSRDLSDEGAANHTRFLGATDHPATHVFTYGFDPRDETPGDNRRFLPRQSLRACQAIARQHRLAPESVVYARQTARAIDLGAFHHDVVGVGHRRSLFQHRDAWADRSRVLKTINDRFDAAREGRLRIYEIDDDAMSIDEAVTCYLFNSQIVSTSSGQTTLVAPAECEADPNALALISQATLRPPSSRPFDAFRFIDVRESMRNGGGPACLRLRVVMNADERNVAKIPWFDAGIESRLRAWATDHYRESISQNDLADSRLLAENARGLLEIATLLGLERTSWHRALLQYVDRWKILGLSG